MDKVAFRDLAPGDIPYVAAYMRAPDRQEIYAATGLRDPLYLLWISTTVSSRCWTAERNFIPLAIFGVAPVAPGVGSPWLLGTDEVFKVPRTLVRDGRRYVRQMLTEYPRLRNYVDARNVHSVRWLAHLGFTVHPPAPYGALGMPFHMFEMEAVPCALQ